MNLVFIERMNRLSEKIILLREEAERRKKQKPHPKVGQWRHEYNIEALEAQASSLERRRMALIGFVKPFRTEKANVVTVSFRNGHAADGLHG